MIFTILIIIACVLSFCAAANMPSRIGLFPAAFGFYMLALLVGSLPLLQH